MPQVPLNAGKPRQPRSHSHIRLVDSEQKRRHTSFDGFKTSVWPGRGKSGSLRGKHHKGRPKSEKSFGGKSKGSSSYSVTFDPRSRGRRILHKVIDKMIHHKIKRITDAVKMSVRRRSGPGKFERRSGSGLT